MASRPDRGPLGIFLLMALFVLLAVPFVAVIWETLNHALAFQFSVRLLWAVPAALILAVLLTMLARTLTRSFH